MTKEITFGDLRCASDREIRETKRVLVYGARITISDFAKQNNFENPKVVSFKWVGGKGEGTVGYKMKVLYD